jgi:hypothetical protein
MTTFYIHYRKSDGAIFGFEIGVAEPSQQPGLAHIEMDLEFPPDITNERIDVARLALIEKTADELAADAAEAERQALKQLAAIVAARRN